MVIVDRLTRELARIEERRGRAILRGDLIAAERWRLEAERVEAELREARLRAERIEAEQRKDAVRAAELEHAIARLADRGWRVSQRRS